MDYDSFEVIVSKFGGTSVANADCIRNLADIVRSDPKRRVSVVSFFGTDKTYHNKGTEVLCNIFSRARDIEDIGIAYKRIPGTIRELEDEIILRVYDVANDLGLDRSIGDWYTSELSRLKKSGSSHEFVSSGEKVVSRIVGAVLKTKVLDAKDLIHINDRLNPDNPTSYAWIREHIRDGMFVIPGFYGNHSLSRDNPEILTLPRDGSTLTGAVVARALGVKTLYEVWTDQDGILPIDPRLLTPEEKKTVRPTGNVTYWELRELGYSGAKIVQDESMLPLIPLDIPMSIRNSFNLSSPGTLVSATKQSSNEVIGISGQPGFVSIEMKKYLLNNEKGFLNRLTNILYEEDIPIEHSPTGVDKVTLVISQDNIKGKEERLVSRLKNELEVPNVKVTYNMGLVSVVGEGITYNPAIDAKIFAALADINVSSGVVSKGSDNSMIIGIDENKLNETQRQLYFKLF